MKKYFFIGGIVFFVSMLVMMPANMVAKLLPNHIGAHQYHGNIWQGSAASLTVNKVNLGSVKWDVRPACFLLLKLCADITQNHHSFTSSFLLKVRNSTELENIIASGDVSVLNKMVSQYGITLAGDFQADLAEVTFSDDRIKNINGDMKFSSLAVNGVLRVLLGDLNSTFEPQDEHTLIQINNDQGHVDISGIVQLFEDMTYDLDMQIRQNEQSTDAIKNGMQYIGDRQADGSVRLQQNGKIAI